MIVRILFNDGTVHIIEDVINIKFDHNTGYYVFNVSSNPDEAVSAYAKFVDGLIVSTNPINVSISVEHPFERSYRDLL